MNPMIDLATAIQSLGTAGTFLIVLIKATLILLIARLLLAVLPRVSAAAKHLGVTVALCSVLALPVVTFLVPAWRVAVLPSDPAQSATTPSEAIGSTGDDQEYGALSAAVTVVRATGVVPQERITAIQRFFDTVKNSWKGIILIAIGFISLLFLGRMAIGILGVGSVARSSEEVLDDVALRELDSARDHLQLGREVRLLRSPRVTVPVVWGVFKPILLLPASSMDWSRERLRVVLLHELAHVKRGDGITLLITRAAVAIFWFHPLMWALERAGRAECERACDDLVLESGTKPSDYAEHLLNIARALPHFDPFRSVTLAMSRRSQLEGRLLSILQPHIRRGNFSLRAVSTACALALMVIVPLASVRLVAAPPNGGEKPIPEGVVDIGPNYAAKIAAAPQSLINKLDRLYQGKDYKPESADEWYDYGMELHHADRYPEAIAAFQEAIRGGHRVAGSTYNIACGYALMGDEKNALQWLRASIEKGFDIDRALEDSDFDPIRTSRGFQQIVSEATGGQDRGDERINETLERYATLRSENSEDGKEWFDAGLDLLRLRQLNESIDAYTRAIDLGQKTSTAMYNLACAYALKGETTTAQRWLERAIENGFDSVEKLENDPDLNTLRGQADFADMKALARDLRLHSGKQKFALFDDEQQSWRATLPRYRALTEKYPRIGRTWFNLGYAQLQSGDNRASAASFQRAIDLDYRTPTSTYNMACAYARDGQRDAAINALEKARALGFQLEDYLDDDSDLEALYDEPRFQELRRQVAAEPKWKHRKEEKKKHKVEHSSTLF
jgi:beta-lactamase regulating signal transducer with metallopeptidase domain/Flp pilus assembly protein TadD